MLFMNKSCCANKRKLKNDEIFCLHLVNVLRIKV